MTEQTKGKGVQEWTKHSHNICLGCENDCSYCYAKAHAHRMQWLSKDKWAEMTLHYGKKKITNGHGQVVMFPTTHDIFESNVEAYIKELLILLNANWRILIVTKPRLKCITEIIDSTKGYHHRLEFRLSINSDSNRDLFEPKTPTIEERLNCAKLIAYNKIKLSISCEPCLLSPLEFQDLLEKTESFGCEIWLGLMNGPGKKLLNAEQKAKIAYIEDLPNIEELYKISQDWNETHSNHVTFKETFRRRLIQEHIISEDES